MHTCEPRNKAWETAEPRQSIFRNYGLSGTLQGGSRTFIKATASISQKMSSCSSSQQQLSSHSHSHWKRLMSSSQLLQPIQQMQFSSSKSTSLRSSSNSSGMARQGHETAALKQTHKRYKWLHSHVCNIQDSPHFVAPFACMDFERDRLQTHSRSAI